MRRVLTALLLLLATPAVAQAPSLMPIQGTIHDSGGAPLDGPVDVRFALYTAEVDGEQVWTETRTVNCAAGFFTVYLGEVTPLDLADFATQGPLWLGLTVEDDAETDRLLIGTTGYAAFAQHAGDAATLQGASPDALRDWNGLLAVPAGFSDGVDNEGGATTDASLLTSGTVSTDRYSAYGDLAVEGWLDGADGNDLVTRSQGDGRYVDEGQPGSVGASMLQDGASLAEIADDDGAGSGLDADTLDGRDATALRPVVATSQSSATTYLTTSCQNYVNGAVTLVAPGSGTVVVEANAWTQLEHTSGTTDSLVLAIGTSTTDCSDVFGNVRWEIPGTVGTDSLIDQTFTVRRAFAVTAGTYTYYLNGYMASGQSAQDRFWFAAMVATYYPD